MANSFCDRGEKALYFSFEESAQQITRNMRMIGLDLQKWVRKGLLQFQSSRPSHYGLEMHLALMQRNVERFQPHVVILDPVNNLVAVGSDNEVTAMLTRLIDFLKSRGITTFFTGLTGGGEALEATNVGMSSLMDTWVLLRDIENAGERSRGLYVLKSRGMSHSNQIREFVISSNGIQLLDVYSGPEGVLTGTARLTQEAKRRAEVIERQNELEKRRAIMEHKRQSVQAQISALKADLQAAELAFDQLKIQEDFRSAQQHKNEAIIRRARQADTAENGKK
jgi:circadian clock protein KaiC